MTPASSVLRFRLQVGRFLPAPLLGLAVFLRDVPGMLLGSTHSGMLAPAWVVAEDAAGRRVLEVFAGREAGHGEWLLRTIQEDAELVDVEQLVRDWSGYRPWLGPPSRSEEA